MNRRYAVLWDLDSQPGGREAGLLVERDGCVLVDVATGYGIQHKQVGEFQVSSPDGTLVTYRPGDRGYFDQLLVALSSTFAIGEHGTYDDGKMLVHELYFDKVQKPLVAKQRQSYSPTYSERYRPSRESLPTYGSRRAVVA